MKKVNLNMFQKPLFYVGCIGLGVIVYFFGIIATLVILVPTILGMFLGKDIIKEHQQSHFSNLLTGLSLFTWLWPALWCFVASAGFFTQKWVRNKSYHITLMSFAASLIHGIIQMMAKGGYL